jgi:hypothetical protein
MRFHCRWYRGVVNVAAALAVLGGAGAAAAQSAAEYQKIAPGSAAAQTAADAREVFIATVHLDGNANSEGDAKHPPEPFPANPPPAGGGLILTPPDGDGAWRMRAFLFEPRQVVVFQGNPVKLSFVGVQGPSHRIQVDGLSDVIDLKRGEVRTVTIPADTPGVIGFRSLDRLPSMQGSVVILPKP